MHNCRAGSAFRCWHVLYIRAAGECMHAYQTSTTVVGLQAAEDGVAAGTSSFGMSGVNAHLLLLQIAEAVPPVPATKVRMDVCRH